MPIDRDLFRYSNYRPDRRVGPEHDRASDLEVRDRAQRPARGLRALNSCGNCHGAQHGARYWLTDALLNAEGWIDGLYEPDEIGADAGVVQPVPIPFDD